jgi:hypothetical protein
MPRLSDAVAEIFATPFTVEPAAGEVMLIVGGVVSVVVAVVESVLVVEVVVATVEVLEVELIVVVVIADEPSHSFVPAGVTGMLVPTVVWSWDSVLS